MIRRSPCEVYLRYLILHPSGFKTDNIIDACKYAQLDYVGPPYLERLRKEMTPPSPFRPFDRTQRESYLFLLRHGLTPIFYPDESGKRAFQLLQNPRAKEFVEAMTLSGAPLPAIANALTTQKNYPCTTQDLERYCAFFWDLNKCDSTEIRSLLSERVEHLAHDTSDDVKRQYGSMKRAFWNDPRRIAADLPSSPFMSVISQMKMGLMPVKVDVHKSLEMSMGIISLRILEAAVDNGIKASTRTLEYANSLRVVKEVSDTLVRPDDKLQEDLRKLTVRTSPHEIPQIHQLSKGNHTIEVVPDPEKEDEYASTDDYDGSLGGDDGGEDVEYPG